MADALLQITLQKLDSLLVKEEQLLGGVESGVKDIRDELESIKSALQEADSREDNDGMRTWVRQVRELAYDIEDVLEEFMLHFGQRHGHGLLGSLRRFAHGITHFRTRRQIATAIQEIKAQVRNISSRRNMYTIGTTDECTSTNAVRERLYNRHLASLFIEEAELVGIDRPREALIGRLLTAEDQLKVIPVVGMGGLGKTTLVRKIYDNEKVKGEFNCHAWITVTRAFTYEDILRSILTQLYGVRNEPLPEMIDTMEGVHLVETLRAFLQDKRYLVVLDDVWHLNAWECLKYAFPQNRYGSRILITTRIGDVGLSCQEPSGCIYYLEPLPPMEAWSLFSKKAFRNMAGGVCPERLKDLSENIVKICGGLPLAIVTIGGLLSKKQTFLEWKTLHDNLHSKLADNPNLQPITRILLMSYNDLPHVLKSCFLYFSIFPKDHTVKRITLIRLWISEGFIESDKGETLENIAESYLNDLIDRSMVQVAEYYDHGRVISCKVHDLIHAIVVSKSKEENFCTSLVRKKQQMNRRIRRLSIQKTDDDVLKDTILSHVRALFVFEANSLAFSSIRSQLQRFRLLKILDLQGAPIDRFPIEFGNLLHLRYLSLRNTKIRKLSKSIGNLRNLETLDLKGTYVSELPKNILKLRKLRHLLAYHYHTGRLPLFYYSNGVKVPKGIGRLKKLQKLTYLAANGDSNIVKELGNLTQLKRLGIMKLRRKDGTALCSSVEKMKGLLSFSVQSIDTDEILDLTSLKSPPPVLQGLNLRGPLHTLPHWISSLGNLVRMRLRWSRLKEGSLGPLQSLPNLVELTLIHAYDGVELRCERGGFEKLQILDLEQLVNLKLVVVEGAMPNLRKMYIRGCMLLKAVPLGIERLDNLRELHLFGMPDAFIQTLRRNEGPEYSKVKHVPIKRSYDNVDRLYEEL